MNSGILYDPDKPTIYVDFTEHDLLRSLPERAHAAMMGTDRVRSMTQEISQYLKRNGVDDAQIGHLCQIISKYVNIVPERWDAMALVIGPDRASFYPDPNRADHAYILHPKEYVSEPGGGLRNVTGKNNWDDDSQWWDEYIPEPITSCRVQFTYGADLQQHVIQAVTAMADWRDGHPEDDGAYICFLMEITDALQDDDEHAYVRDVGRMEMPMALYAIIARYAYIGEPHMPIGAAVA